MSPVLIGTAVVLVVLAAIGFGPSLLAALRRRAERPPRRAPAPIPYDPGRERREATMVRDFSEIPRGTERVVFFPPAAGG